MSINFDIKIIKIKYRNQNQCYEQYHLVTSLQRGILSVTTRCGHKHSLLDLLVTRGCGHNPTS